MLRIEDCGRSKIIDLAPTESSIATAVRRYDAWAPPPFHKANDTTPWSVDEMNSDRARVVETLKRMVDERSHLAAPQPAVAASNET